jgi:hypothetical protein
MGDSGEAGLASQDEQIHRYDWAAFEAKGGMAHFQQHILHQSSSD